MKNIGIVRKLDSLGRVVIPKEYRKLLKISQDDPIEITVNDKGEVALKKFDLSKRLKELAQPIIETIVQETKKPIIVCDLEKVILVSGIESQPQRASLLGALNNKHLNNIIDFRKPFLTTATELGFEIDECEAYICPIISGEPFGAIIQLASSSTSSEVILKMAAALLASEM